MRIYFLLFGLFLFSCKKAEDRSCFKFVGDEKEKTVQLGNFYRIDVGPYMDYVLVQDTACFVSLIGGENVLNFVDLNLDADQQLLEVRNTNTCRFLRSKKKKITVEIHFKQLEEIFFEGSGTMTNVGQLNLPYVVIILNESSGTIDLNLESKVIRISAEPSWANFVLTGHTEDLSLTAKANAYADTRGLTVDSTLTVISKSSADVYVNADATNFFRCETWGSGNVYYSGTPAWQEWNNHGTGQLLKYE